MAGGEGGKTWQKKTAKSGFGERLGRKKTTEKQKTKQLQGKDTGGKKTSERKFKSDIRQW